MNDVQQLDLGITSCPPILSTCLEDANPCDLETMTWSICECTGPLPEGRLGPHVAIYQNCLFAYGGYTGKFRLGDVHRLDLVTKKWSPVSANGQIPGKRMCATCVSPSNPTTITRD